MIQFDQDEDNKKEAKLNETECLVLFTNSTIGKTYPP
jgi:hypothetical protein